MRNLKDLKLRKKTEAKVQAWLQEWLNLFVIQADGRQGNVYRADFEQEDFFYFTSCDDIISKDPEFLAQETNSDVMRRKQRVHLQLLMKNLLGEFVPKKIKCSHCGYEDRYIGKMYNGHYVYCPKCHYLSANGYLETMGVSITELMAKLHKEAQIRANNEE